MGECTSVQIAPLGIFVGFAAAQNGDIPVLKKTIKKLFSDYRRTIFDNFYMHDIKEDKAKKLSELQKKYNHDKLYKPITFCTLGDFDLAFISLIDDFEFGIRSFMPFSPALDPQEDKIERDEEEYNIPFDHQSLFGFIPFSSDPQHRNLEITPELPLIAISKLKISTSLLFSYGSQILFKYIECLNTYFDKIPNIKALVFTSLSWNEIGILFFSNSYERIFSCITEIHSWCIEDIIKNCDFKEDDFLLFENTGSHLKHPIIKKVNSTLGFSFEIFKELRKEPVPCKPDHKKKDRIKDEKIKQPFFEKIDEYDSIGAIIELRIEGNSLNDIITLINQCITIEGLTPQLISGESDIVYIKTNHQNSKIKSKDLLKLLITLHTNASLKSSILSIKSTILGTYQEKVNTPSLIDNETRKKYWRKIKGTQFDITQIKGLRRKLSFLGVSKAISENIINMVVEYNVGINDRVSYANYLELAKFLQDLIGFIETQYAALNADKKSNYNCKQFNDILSDASHAYYNAFLNRFHQGFYTNDLSDYNIYFKSGIQVLINSYSGIYSSYCNFLGIRQGLIYIEGNYVITSTVNGISLNYFHLFFPAKLCYLSFHEALQQYIHQGFLDKEYAGFAKKIIFELNNTPLEMVKSYSYSRMECFLASRELPTDDISKLLEHVYADYLCFNLLFARDWKIYISVYIGFFFSSPHNYTTPSEICEKKLLYYFLRIGLLLCLLRNEVDFSEKDFIGEFYFKVAEVFGVSKRLDIDKLSPKLKENIEITELFLERLKGVEDMTKILALWRSIVNITEDLYLFMRRDEFLSGWMKIVSLSGLNKMNSLLKKTEDCNNLYSKEQHSETLKNFRALFSQTVSKIELSFDSKTYFNFFEINSSFGILVPNAAIYEYFRGICSSFFNPSTNPQKINQRNKVLKRNKINSTDTYLLQKNDASVLFDPLSGVFCYDPERRMKNFLNKAIMLNLLWDFSLNKARDQIRGIKLTDT